jgi:hypothetical protein
MQSLKFRLYDEENHRLVGFGYVKEARKLRLAQVASMQPSI